MSKPHRCKDCQHPGGVNRRASNAASKKSCSCWCHVRKQIVEKPPIVVAAEQLADASGLSVEDATVIIEKAVRAEPSFKQQRMDKKAAKGKRK